MLIKISDFAVKSLITCGIGSLSALSFMMSVPKSSVKSIGLVSAPGGGQILDKPLKVVTKYIPDVLLNLSDKSSSHSVNPTEFKNEIREYNTSSKQLPPKMDTSKEETSFSSENLKVSGDNSWISHLLTTLETPMFTRMHESFVNSLKAEFPVDMIDKLSEFQNSRLDKSDVDLEKRVYLMSLNLQNKQLDLGEYKKLSELARHWFEEIDSSSQISYRISKTSSFNGLKINFYKVLKGIEYSLEIEYLYDLWNKAPMLHSNYVYYKDPKWWKGGYYQAEGGQGWQKHIGKTDFQILGNPNSSINLSFVNAFTTGKWEDLTRWWAVLSNCSEEEYCRKSLTDTRNTYIKLPENYYRDKKLDRYSREFHPLVSFWKKSFKENYSR